MKDLMFSLNATVPVFLLMVLGCMMRRSGLISARFAASMNTFVFKVALPVNLFAELYGVNIRKLWDGGYVLFCFAATLLSAGIALAVSFLFRERSVRGEFVQGAYRGSASLLGMAYIENIYRDGLIGTLMMLGCVPIYNIIAVAVLSLMNPDGGKMDGNRMRRTLAGILTNPIIWGILLGFAWALSGLPMPEIPAKTIDYIGRMASPMGLLALGASLDFQAIRKQMKPILTASFLRLIGFCAITSLMAVHFGYRDQKLVASVIMSGSAATVAGYVMAKNMGYRGAVSSGIVMVTTVMSSFTLTFWLWLFRSLGYI